MTSSSRFGQRTGFLRTRSTKRRPAGISRRKKRQLSVETLEDRRMMAGDTPLTLSSSDSIYSDLVSYSSSTAEGALAIWTRELEQYAAQSNATTTYTPLAIPTDPLVSDQWHLINVGQQVGQPDFQNIFGIPGEDINVAPVWNAGITGEGVRVGVFEVGGVFQVTHPDLASNVDPDLSFLSPGAPDDAHATSVAGIIGAVAENGLGGTGVAHGATLVPMGDVNLVSIGDAFRFTGNNGIDITNNSWGPGGGRSVSGPTPDEFLGLRDSIFFGRVDDNGNPLGVIHVFASGNSASSVGVGPPAQDSSSYNGWVNSRYTIGVTGVDHDGEYNNVDGTVTSYMEIGASVLVAAPTGSNALSIFNDDGIGSGILTTDLIGEAGFNTSDNTGGLTGDRDFLEDIDYTSRFNGTSAATPMVSGVVALMLEANPNLHWRDVQEILLRSARQNSKFATQADGADKSLGIEYQNTWITNQVPLFHDPDIYDPLIPNDLQILNPTLDPSLTIAFNTIHYAPTPQILTNGAGYTVSQGRGTNGDQTGFAHGVVDAEMAVLMAQQWHTKDQGLPDELSFTTAVGFNRAISLPAAEVVNDLLGGGTTDLIIPGGLGGDPGFGAYWDEYLVDDPDFTQGFFERGAPLELTVTSPNDMTIETIELSFTTSGDVTEFMDNVRVVLVSPNGTHSELNPYFVDPSFDVNENIHQAFGITANGLNGVSSNIPDFLDAGSVGTGGNTLTYSTNRSWGERSDDAIIFDPTTAEPVIDPFGIGGNRFNAGQPFAGDLLTQGWQVYMENYSPVATDITDFEITWHGSPINANTERVQGLIGVDDNQDDLFNYSRVIQQISQIDLDPALRLGEVQNIIDPNHESMGSNVTVFAHRDVNSNGILDGSDILVDQFVTGYDGNYYFDLVPNDYIISIDPLSLGGFTPIDDSLTPSGFLPEYQTEWAISSDYFQVWDYEQVGVDAFGTPINEVPINQDTGAPFAFLDGTNTAITYGMQNINFLLDPGAPAAPEVSFTGTIIADTDGDGLFNSDDVAVEGIGVFGDVNRNGQYDAGEILTTTDIDGNYSLTVPQFTETTVINVGIRPPAQWTTTNPVDGFQSFFTQQGDTFDNVDFYVMPPAGVTSGDGSALSGVILGTVFNDVEEDGTRDPGDVGVQNLTVYVDMNNSGAIDANDVVTQTNSNGSYSFSGLADGNYILRLDLAPNSGILQTSPSFGLPQQVTITSGGTANDTDFGVTGGGGGNGGPSGNLDFGDLPDTYGTTLASNGARHTSGSYFLGSLIDTESDGVAGSDADGDDSNFVNDEDGVVLLSGLLNSNTQGTFQVTASRSSGFLQVWMDFDNDGSFSSAEQVVVNKLLPLGTSNVNFDIPTINGARVYTRVRYGEAGLGSVGPALLGEVEDYVFDAVVVESAPLVANADSDGDGMVTGLDFLNWQLNAGMASGASVSEGDANSDGAVDRIDMVHWELQYGENSDPGSGTAAITVPGYADFDQDGMVSGLDFLAWQTGAGTLETATLADGDGNYDGDVNGADLAAWQQSYGDVYSQSVGSGNGAASFAAKAPELNNTADNLRPSVTGDLSNSAALESSVISTAGNNSLLSFVASRLEDVFAGYHRLDRNHHFGSLATRLESHLLENSNRFESLEGEILPALEDAAERVVDGLFDRLDHKFHQLPFGQPDGDGQEVDGMESAFEETAEWRFA